MLTMLLILVLLALDLTAADDATDTATANTPETNSDATVEQDDSSGVGKLSEWWNDYIAKVKASSPTPVWIKGSSKKTPEKVPLWWLDVEVPSTTRRRWRHKFPMDWPEHFLGQRDPKFGPGVPKKDHHPTGYHDHKLGEGDTQKGVATCPPCPCQSTAQNCPHCGCHSTTKCHDQTTDNKSGDKDKPENKDTPSDKDKSNGKDDSGSKDKPNDKDGSSDKDKSNGKDGSSDKDKSDGKDGSSDKDKSNGKDGSSDKDESDNDKNGKTKKPFKKCTCITRPMYCGYPCPNVNPCTCPPKALVRSGRSSTVEVVKSDASSQAVVWWWLCLISPFLSRNISLI